LVKNRNNKESIISKNAETQRRILDIMPNYGIINPYQLKEELKESPQSISRAFRKLSERGMINIISIEKQHQPGPAKRNYGLTDKGIRWLLDNNKLNFEQLWKIAITCFDKKYKFSNGEKIQTTINEYFHSFETNNGMSKKHFFHISDNLQDNIDEFLERRKREIGIFSEKGRIDQEPEYQKNIKAFFLELIEKGEVKWSDRTKIYLEQFHLIQKYINNNKLSFQLTPWGDLIYSKVMLEDFSKLFKIEQNIISQEKKINDFKNNKEKTYPYIFKHWKKILEITEKSKYTLMTYFLFFYRENYEKFFEQEIDIYKWNGQENPNILDYDIINLHFQMEEELKTKFRHEYDAGIKIVKKWALKNNCIRTIFNQGGFLSKSMRVYAMFSSKSDKKRKELSKIEIESEKQASFLELESKFQEEIKNKTKDEDLVYSEKNQDITNEQFMNKFKSEKIPKKEDIRKIYSKIIPLSKLAELFNSIMVSDYEIRNDSKLVKEKLPDYYEPLRNVISFRFYIALKIHTSQEIWENLMNDPEMSDVKKWFNEWIDAIKNYHNKRIELISNNVRIIEH